MDRVAAQAEIHSVFSTYRAITSTDRRLVRALKTGKLYELYVLSRVVEALRLRGCRLRFSGSVLKFKGGPGMLKTSDAHFKVVLPSLRRCWLFVDIEFDTLGHHRTGGVSDNSRRHELDIVLVTRNSGYPTHEDILLAVECKSTAKFGKGIVKEILGVRRELGYVTSHQRSILTRNGCHPRTDVPCAPPSEHWLAFVDPKGSDYAESPAAFGITFQHWEP